MEWEKLEKSLNKLSARERLAISKYIGTIGHQKKFESCSTEILRKLWNEYKKNKKNPWEDLRKAYEEYEKYPVDKEYVKNHFKHYFSRRNIKRIDNDELKFFEKFFDKPKDYLMYGVRIEEVKRDNRLFKQIVIENTENINRLLAPQNDTKQMFISLTPKEQKALCTLVFDLEIAKELDMLEER